MYAAARRLQALLWVPVRHAVLRVAYLRARRAVAARVRPSRTLISHPLVGSDTRVFFSPALLLPCPRVTPDFDRLVF